MTQNEEKLFDRCTDALLDIHLLMNGAIKLYEDEGMYIRKALYREELWQACCALNSIGQALYLSLERTENAICHSDFYFVPSSKPDEEKD